MRNWKLSLACICLAALLAGCGQAPMPTATAETALGVKPDATETELPTSEAADMTTTTDAAETEDVLLTEPTQGETLTVPEVEQKTEQTTNHDSISEETETTNQPKDSEEPTVASIIPTISPTGPETSTPISTEPKPTEHVHNWSEWSLTKEPTCGAAGEEIHTCPGCGKSESRSVSATEKHTWGETPPTCTQDGVKVCKSCGKSEAIPALGHAWEHQDEEGHWQVLITQDTGGFPASVTGNVAEHVSAYRCG